MGVKGLTTFLNNNRQSLTETVRLDRVRDGDDDSQRIPAVIDAWGIIFQLYQDSLPWASGGEYLRFFRLVRTLVVAWRNVGLEPIFVFDGTTPAAKHPEVLKRLQDKLSLAQAFYAAYPPSRSSPSFSRYEVILPPLAMHTFIYALSTMNVKCHFIPEGEADGVCVSVAEELGAYIFGNDSDYLILTAGTKVKGYVPTKDLMWIEGSAEDDLPPLAGPSHSMQTEWSTTNRHGNRQRRNAPRGSPLLPSSELRKPNLVLTVVRPDAFPRRLRLPATILPLFSSLVGNDYTPPSAPDHFFESHLDFSQKVERVARILREILASPRARTPDAGDSTTALVSKAVNALLVKPWPTEGKVDLVDAIIEATMQYLPPVMGTPCAAFPFCGAVSTALCSSHAAIDSEAAKKYASAQRTGLLGSLTHAWLHPGRVYSWSVLEDPNAPSFKASDGSRGMRKLAWEVLEEGLDGLRWGPPTEEEIRQWEEDRAVKSLLRNKEETLQASSDSSISGSNTPVTTSSSDREELNILLGVEARPASQTASASTGQSTMVDLSTRDVTPDDPPTHTKLRIITEYLRQGTATRVVPVEVPLGKRLEVPRARCLLSLRYRLRIYLKAQRSDIESVIALPAHIQPIVALLRMCILESVARAKNDTALWRRTEVETVLRACLGSWTAWQATLSSKKIRPTGTVRPQENERYPLLESRNAGIVAQLTATIMDALLLAQALLLLPDQCEQPGLPHMTPFVWFSGMALHSMLIGDAAPEACWKWSDETEATYERCIQAVMDGMAGQVWDRPLPNPKSPARSRVGSEQQMAVSPSHGQKHERSSEVEGQNVWRGGRWRGRGGHHSQQGRSNNGFNILANLDTSS